MANYRSSGKELRRSPKGAVAAVLALLLAGGAGFGAYQIARQMQPIEIEESSVVELSVPDITETTDEVPRTIFEYETRFVSEMHTGALILANNATPLPEDPKDGLVSVYEEKAEHLHVRDVSVEMQKEAMDALNRMTEDFFKATGNEDLLVNTAFRTKEYQKQLYDADLAATGEDSSARVAMPGCSDHETGYGFDLSLFIDGSIVDYDGTGIFTWVTDHCANYGFILRFPKDKITVTGFPHEPWHLRYVGVPHALYMEANNLCLEEYIDLLATHPYEGEHLEIPDAEGNVCEVFSVPVTDTDDATVAEIPVAAELPYTVSGNNRDGFIVCVETGRPMETETETTPETTAPDAEVPPADQP